MKTAIRPIETIAAELDVATARAAREPGNDVIRRAVDRLSREKGVATIRERRVAVTVEAWRAVTAGAADLYRAHAGSKKLVIATPEQVRAAREQTAAVNRETAGTVAEINAIVSRFGIDGGK